MRLRLQICSFQKAPSLKKEKKKDDQNFWKKRSFPEICYLSFFKKRRYFPSKVSIGWLFSNPSTRQITTFLTTAFQPSNPTKNCAIRILNTLGTELIPDGIQLYSSLQFPNIILTFTSLALESSSMTLLKCVSWAQHRAEQFCLSLLAVISSSF